MTPSQILLSALLAAAVTAAPQKSLDLGYIPPPEETYLPPDTTTTPSPEYLPPLENEYLPPPENQYLPPPPSNEYLPPPPSEEYLPPPTPPSEEYLPPPQTSDEYLQPPAVEEEVDSSSGMAASAVDNSLTEGTGEDTEAAGGQGGGGGKFDDGKYRPQKYNSGKYDPNAGKYRPVGDDGSYRPEEQVTFPPIEDFEFAYAVKDKDSGNDYAVNESNKGGAYKILLPDGRTQIVQYVIDSRGIYRSRITYLQPDGKP